jgi:hypothetical protein
MQGLETSRGPSSETCGISPKVKTVSRELRDLGPGTSRDALAIVR